MAVKKWKRGEKPSLIFATTHKDRTGGGELYAHQVAHELQGMCDLRYYTGNTGTLNPEFSKYHKARHHFTATALLHSTDIFVTCSHFQVPQPMGRERNIVLTFFPNKEHKSQVQPYDTVITCSRFSAMWVKKYWGKTAKVVYPYVNVDDYEIGEKDAKTIVSVGRFFREPHGHSKRQDALVESFALLCDKDPEWKLRLCGSAFSGSDHKYLDFCRTLAKERGVGDRVEFFPNIQFSELQRLYARTEFYWHANGYESNNPYETEHFGIVIAEAMASGCIPVVYRGGGYEDFGSYDWEKPLELAKITLGIRNNSKYDIEALKKDFRHFVCEKFSQKQMNIELRDILFRR